MAFVGLTPRCKESDSLYEGIAGIGWRARPVYHDGGGDDCIYFLITGASESWHNVVKNSWLAAWLTDRLTKEQTSWLTNK